MGSKAACLLLTMALLAGSPSALLSDYSHVFAYEAPNIATQFFFPAPCAEFEQAYDYPILETTPARSQFSPAVDDAKKARRHLVLAAMAARFQKARTGVKEADAVAYAIAAFECRAQALDALELAIGAEAKALAAADDGVRKLDYAYDGSYTGPVGGARALVDEVGENIENRAEGEGLGHSLWKAGFLVSSAMRNANSGKTGIAEAVKALTAYPGSALSETLVLDEMVSNAVDSLEREFQMEKEDFDARRGTLEERLALAKGEKLGEVTVEQDVPAAQAKEGIMIVSATDNLHGSIRDAAAKAGVAAGEADALAESAEKTKKEGGKGGVARAIVQFRSANAKLGEADGLLEYAVKKAEGLEQYLESEFHNDLTTARASATRNVGKNVFGATAAMEMLDRAEGEFLNASELPLGRRINAVEEALELAGKATAAAETAYSVEEMKNQVEAELDAATDLAKNAGKDGIDAGVEEKRLEEIKTALSLQPEYSAEEARRIAGLLAETREVRKALEAKVDEKSAVVESGLYSNLTVFKDYLTPSDAAKLGEYGMALSSSAGEKAGELGAAEAWMEGALSGVLGREGEIASKRVLQNSVFSEKVVGVVALGEKGVVEVVFSSRNDLPLSGGEVVVKAPLLAEVDGKEPAVVESTGILKMDFNKGELVVNGSSGANHSLTVRYSEVIAVERGEKRTVRISLPQASVEVVVEFNSSRRARVLVRKEAGGRAVEKAVDALEGENSVVLFLDLPNPVFEEEIAAAEGRKAYRIFFNATGLDSGDGINWEKDAGCLVKKASSPGGGKEVFHAGGLVWTAISPGEARVVEVECDPAGANYSKAVAEMKAVEGNATPAIGTVEGKDKPMADDPIPASYKEEALELAAKAASAVAAFDKAFSVGDEISPYSKKPLAYKEGKTARDKAEKAGKEMEKMASSRAFDQLVFDAKKTQLEDGMAGALNAAEQMKEDAEAEVNTAVERSKQLGANAAKTTSQKAATALDEGRFFTAYVLASQAREQALASPSASSPPWWLAGAAGIVILTAVAYYVVRKPGEKPGWQELE